MRKPDAVISRLRPSVKDRLLGFTLYRKAMTNRSKIFICYSKDLFVKKLPFGLDWKTALTFVDGELLGMPKNNQTLSLIEENGRIYVIPSAVLYGK